MAAVTLALKHQQWVRTRASQIHLDSMANHRWSTFNDVQFCKDNNKTRNKVTFLVSKPGDIRENSAWHMIICGLDKRPTLETWIVSTSYLPQQFSFQETLLV